MSQTFDQIKNDISSHDVVLYMKGNAQFPMCGFSATVVHVLNALGVNFKAIDVLQDNDLREGIKIFTSLSFILKVNLWAGVISSVKCMRQANFKNFFLIKVF